MEETKELMEAREARERDLRYIQQMNSFGMSPQMSSNEQQIFINEVLEQQRNSQQLQQHEYTYSELEQQQQYYNHPQIEKYINRANHYGYTNNYPTSNDYEDRNAVDEYQDIKNRRKFIRTYANNIGTDEENSGAEATTLSSNMMMNSDLMVNVIDNRYENDNNYYDGNPTCMVNSNNVGSMTSSSVVSSNDDRMQFADKVHELFPGQYHEEQITPTYINMMFNATSMIPLENVSKMIKNEPIEMIDEVYETNEDKCTFSQYEFLGQCIPVVDLCSLDNMNVS